MFRRNVTLRALPIVAAAVIIIAGALVLAMSGGTGASRSSAATSSGNLASSPQFGPTPVAHYQESSPHVASRLSVFGVQGTVRGQPAAPAAEVPPVSAAAFRAPVTVYRAYSGGRLRLM